MWKQYQIKDYRHLLVTSPPCPLFWYMNPKRKWRSINWLTYWYYKLTGKREVKVDVYYRCIPLE